MNTLPEILRAAWRRFRSHLLLFVPLWAFWAWVLGVTMHQVRALRGGEFALGPEWKNYLQVPLFLAGFILGIARLPGSQEIDPEVRRVVGHDPRYAWEHLAEWRSDVAAKTALTALGVWLPAVLGTMVIMVFMGYPSQWILQGVYAAVMWGAPAVVGLGLGVTAVPKSATLPFLIMAAIGSVVYIGAIETMPRPLRPLVGISTGSMPTRDSSFFVAAGCACAGLWWLASAWKRGPGKIELWESTGIGVVLAVVSLMTLSWEVEPGAAAISSGVNEGPAPPALASAWTSGHILEPLHDGAVLLAMGTEPAAQEPPVLGPYEVTLPGAGGATGERWRLEAGQCWLEPEAGISVPGSKSGEGAGSGRGRFPCVGVEVIEAPAGETGVRRAALRIRPDLRQKIFPGETLKFEGVIKVRRGMPLAVIPASGEGGFKTQGMRYGAFPMRCTSNWLVEQSTVASWNSLGPRRFVSLLPHEELMIFLDRDDGRRFGSRMIWLDFEALPKGSGGRSLFAQWSYPRPDFQLSRERPLIELQPEQRSFFNRVYCRILETWTVPARLRLKAP